MEIYLTMMKIYNVLKSMFYYIKCVDKILIMSKYVFFSAIHIGFRNYDGTI